MRLTRKAMFLHFLRATVLGALISILPAPSYAQGKLPRLADSWNGVHSFVTFNPNGEFTKEHIKSIAWRFDFGWSSGKYGRELKAGNPAFIAVAYRSATQSEHAPLTWYQANHPEWILYQADRKTPVQEYEYRGLIPDFTNPAYVDHKWTNAIAKSIASIPDGIGFDNATLGNDFAPTGPKLPYSHACGVYDKPGHWVQKFAGKGSYAEVLDPQFTDGFIAYLGEIRKRLHALPAPKLLIPNTAPQIVYNDPVRRKNFMAAVDGILCEGYNLGPASPGDPRKLWLGAVRFMADMNAAGKCVYAIVGAPYPNEAAMAKDGKAWIQFTLASYLLAKGHHAGLNIMPESNTGGYDKASGIFWPVEFEAAHKIGTPLRPMRQVAGDTDSENGVYLREHSGGVSVVNASKKNSFTISLPKGSSYVDLYGRKVGLRVTMPPTTGLVVLKSAETRNAEPAAK